MYGLFLELRNKPCLVVGGGRVALRKARSLLDADADLTVISPEFVEDLRALAAAGSLRCEARCYAVGEAADYFLIVAATGDPVVNRQIYHDSQTRDRLVNIVDVPELSNFFVPALVKRGDFRLAISTCGAAPGLAKRIRKQLDPIFPETYSNLLVELRRFRRELQRLEPDIDRRKNIMDQVLDSSQMQDFLDGNELPLKDLFNECISSS